MRTALGFLAFYSLLTAWVAWDHKRTWGESLWTVLRRDWRSVVMLVAAWGPAIFAGGYWLVTGRSAFTILFPGW